MPIEVKDQKRLENWVNTRVETPIKNGIFIGNILNNKIVAVVGYTHFNKSKKTICMHIAADSKGKWFTVDFFSFMFDYPFSQLNVESIFAPIKVENKKALKFTKRLGFKEVLKVKDIIFMELNKESLRL